jgi:molecular chaperone DnaK
MNDIVGIDLGTTNSSIGIMDSGFPILIADANGARLTPSVVYFPSADAAPIVGKSALHARTLKPQQTFYSIKRFIGLNGNELSNDDFNVSYAVDRRKGQPIRVIANDRRYSAEEISARILEKLKGDAERALGRRVTRAVITVPAYFNDAQRNATKRAGELAGFVVERIVNEPTAAALAYGLDKLERRSRIAVYDLGGGTFDISILELNNGVFEVLATNGNTRLGGDDIDNVIIADLAAKEFPADDPKAIARLREAVIEAKHRLSNLEGAAIEIPFIDGTRNVSYVLTRDEVERLSREIVEKTRSHCLRALADAKLDPRDLDDVILVGGATRMPLVRRIVAEIFGREPNTSQNPDEAVAIGATIQAGILSGIVRDVILLDVTPLSLGIETFGGLMNIIIPRNSTIPTKAGEMFTTAVNNQRAMSIKVLQGEREMARDNWLLGQFNLQFQPAPKGSARVGVQFEIDANGILHVLARDTKTSEEKTIEISSAIDVSDEAVEAMISDSLDHAFDDMNERVWTETKLKAEEMLTAVSTALARLGDSVDQGEKEKILAAAKLVQEALATNNIKRLKEANGALDDATQGLAAAVVEKAIQDAPS